MAEARVVRSERLTEKIYSLTLEVPGEASPGQFLHVACGEGLLLRRPISICDAENGTMRIVFEVKGEGTKRLAAAKEGDALDVLGPLGHGFEAPEKGRVLLVGGGLGAAPLLLAAKKWDCDAALGFPTADRVMLTEEFSPRVGRLDIATDDGSFGFHGFVTELVRDRLDGYAAIFACGPEPMLRALSKVCAGRPLQVSMERRMGCGVGACLVCAVKLADGTVARACKDGPVFKAEEVDWNG
ncbi:MAG: dihydroorotate dehydrogenase electron transfer subunit [Oscillospiraceae bacterium]|nr:dihydroorotate dehydrogenase electron transfer subunit [Oscillospiraceae bacterium]